MLFIPPDVTVENGMVRVSNIFSGNLKSDIYRTFKTSRINSYLFNIANYTSVSFHEFFALEFYHVLDDLLENSYLRSDKERIIAIQKLMMEKTWLKGTEVSGIQRLNFARLKNLTLKPLDYQREFLELYSETLTRYSLRGILLAAVAGSGKSFTSLAVAECLDADRIVVICPNPAVEQVWESTVYGKDCVYHQPPTCWSYKSGIPYNGQRVAIFHYEALDKAVLMASQLRAGRTMVILDESHNLNDITSKRTKLFLDLCEDLKTEDIILATGTPLKALAIETIPLLRAIDPLFTEEVETLFKKIFAGEATKTTTILSRRLNMISFRVDHKRLNLEEPIYEDISVEIPNGDVYTLDHISVEMKAYATNRIAELTEYLPEAEKFFSETVDFAEKQLLSINSSIQHKQETQIAFSEYRHDVSTIRSCYKSNNLRSANNEMMRSNRFEKNMIIPQITDKKDRDRFKDDKTIVKYLKLKVQGECLGRVLGRKRIDANIDVIKHIDFEHLIDSGHKKTVIFTSYTEVGDHAAKHLKKLKYQPLTVYGEHTKNLSSIVNEFAKDKRKNPLIATYASLSTAVPLTMADTMIIINPPFRDYIMRQTVARINRLGATTQARIFNIQLNTGDKPNICSRNIDILKWSRDQVSLILGIDIEVDKESLPEEVQQEEALSESLEELSLVHWEMPTESAAKPLFAQW